MAIENCKLKNANLKFSFCNFQFSISAYDHLPLSAFWAFCFPPSAFRIADNPKNVDIGGLLH
jgi:hypothetical protein